MASSPAAAAAADAADAAPARARAAEAEEVEEPEHLQCVISKTMFRDPVFVPESGNTYERAALLRFWATSCSAGRFPAPLHRRGGWPQPPRQLRDPLTNVGLSTDTLFPNWDKRREHARGAAPRAAPGRRRRPRRRRRRSACGAPAPDAAVAPPAVPPGRASSALPPPAPAARAAMAHRGAGDGLGAGSDAPRRRGGHVPGAPRRQPRRALGHARGAAARCAPPPPPPPAPSAAAASAPSAAAPCSSGRPAAELRGPAAGCGVCARAGRGRLDRRARRRGGCRGGARSEPAQRAARGADAGVPARGAPARDDDGRRRAAAAQPPRARRSRVPGTGGRRPVAGDAIHGALLHSLLGRRRVPAAARPDAGAADVSPHPGRA
eukprot:scaffold4647_cov393-Prasinococcus_capsulatus_cf.AAC.14